jgi:hypothetical protein
VQRGVSAASQNCRIIFQSGATVYVSHNPNLIKTNGKS